MADQNIFGTFGKAKELRQRILFTLGALIIYRLGTYIPVPGINTTVLNEIVNQTSGGVLGMFNMFSGGALGRMTIFALTIIPYISASIIMQLMTSLSPQIAQLKKEGESGRQTINQYTRYLTVLLATVQAWGFAGDIFLSSISFWIIPKLIGTYSVLNILLKPLLGSLL
mgnify:CR=1 FL=1